MRTSTTYAEYLNVGDTLKITDELWEWAVVEFPLERPHTAKVTGFLEGVRYLFIYLDFGGATLVLDYDQHVQIVTERLAP